MAFIIPAGGNPSPLDPPPRSLSKDLPPTGLSLQTGHRSAHRPLATSLLCPLPVFRQAPPPPRAPPPTAQGGGPEGVAVEAETAASPGPRPHPPAIARARASPGLPGAGSSAPACRPQPDPQPGGCPAKGWWCAESSPPLASVCPTPEPSGKRWFEPGH